MELTKEWIGGFISGEGCFTFILMFPIFSITLSIKDLELLNQIKDFIKIGNVYYKTKKSSSCVYTIYGMEDCQKLINFLEGNIFGDKLIDYENWKIGIKFLESKKIYNSEDRQFISMLRPSQNKERIKINEYIEYIKKTK